MSSSTWLERVLSGAAVHEQEIVDRYTHALLQVARRQMPDRVRRRIDPEDIVQSVYRSFFRRLGEGEFGFEESHDVWRLLAVMTFRKARNQVKHHRRQQRDSFLDVPLQSAHDDKRGHQPADPAPDAVDLAIMVEYLEKLLEQLPDRHRPLVTMRLEGYSVDEIASQNDVSKRTVLRVLAHLRDLAGDLMGLDE